MISPVMIVFTSEYCQRKDNVSLKVKDQSSMKIL